MTDEADFTQTPAFAAAVAAAAEAAVAKAMEGVRAHGAMPDSTGGAAALLSQLALTMVEVGSQGQPHRVTVDPIVMRQRADAHRRMVDLLVDAHARGEKPRYRLLKESYLGDRVVNPFRIGRDKQAIPQEITWSRAPNLSMKPLNSIAVAVFAEFRASIGNVEVAADVSNALMSITTGGLIVHGVSIDGGRRQVGMEDSVIDGDDNGPYSSDDLGVISNDDPRNKNRHVLGTLAESAKMTSSDMPAARV